ncbi:MAG: CDP-alcohol phosphatidyltransferase family protein [Candidatus Nanopelagicales bacterium]
MRVQETQVQTDRVVTVPNVLSFLRLLGVPVFLWLVLGPEADGLAVLLLMVSGFTDYLDGKLARQWNQISRVGQILDPLADRLYIAATLIGLAIREIVPWWLVLLLFGRDAVLGVALLVLRRHGHPVLEVNFLGKAATFNLLYAFPLLLLGDGSGTLALLARVFGWAFAIWGTALYLWAGLLYLWEARHIIDAGPGSPRVTHGNDPGTPVLGGGATG